MNRIAATLLVTLVLISYAGRVTADTVILNGNFSQPGTAPDPFAGWTTLDYPDTGGLDFDRPSDGAGYALFAGTGALSTQLEQTFTLPAGALRLSFEFKIDRTTDGSGEAPISDSFQATLWDSSFGSFFPSNPDLPSAFPSFFSFGHESESYIEYFDSTYVTTNVVGDVTRVTLDVSSLSPQDLTIEFLLNSFDDGWSTKVSLDNVELTTQTPSVVPAPHGMVVLAGLFGMALVARLRSRRPGKAFAMN